MTGTQCRICLQYVDCVFKLDDKVKKRFIWEALNNIANVSIAVGDSFPQLICRTCFDKLDQVVEFQLEVEWSDNVLHSNDIEYVAFIKTEDTLNGTEVIQEECYEETDNAFEPTVIIKSNSGRTIKQNTKIYNEEEFKSRKTIKKEIDIEPEIEIDPTNHSVDSLYDLKIENPGVSKSPAKKRKKKSTHKSHRCCMCQTLFSREIDLKSHVNSTHSPLIEQNMEQKYSTKHAHECIYCKQRFRLVRSLEEHFDDPNFREPPRDRSNEYQNRKNKGLATTKDHQEIVCSYCGKVLTDKSRLRLHELRAHAEKFPIICTYPGCNKRFAAEVILRVHIRNHGEKKHICDFCGRAFLRQKNLISHSYSHKEIKRFHCAHCTRTFTYKHILQRHVESHIEEKVYRCNQCEKTYKWESDLKKHIRGAHLGDLPFKCKFCFKGYFCSSSKKYHEKRCQVASIY